MPHSTLLDGVKHSLRISNTAHDEELSDLISACYEELAIAGVAVQNRANPPALVRQAVILYCKAEFGLNNPDSAKYSEAFYEAKRRLAISTQYGESEGGALNVL